MYFAQTARIKGVVLDENNKPVENANISDGKNKTTTNENGFYSLIIDANKKTSVVFTHISLKRITVVVLLKPNEDQELNPVMNNLAEPRILLNNVLQWRWSAAGTTFSRFMLNSTGLC